MNMIVAFLCWLGNMPEREHEDLLAKGEVELGNRWGEEAPAAAWLAAEWSRSPEGKAALDAEQRRERARLLDFYRWLSVGDNPFRAIDKLWDALPEGQSEIPIATLDEAVVDDFLSTVP